MSTWECCKKRKEGSVNRMLGTENRKKVGRQTVPIVKFGLVKKKKKFRILFMKDLLVFVPG